MLEIILSVALYLGAIALLVRGTFDFCNANHNCEQPVTEQ